MKKDYVKPRVKPINVGSYENLLQSSYVDIGGTTDSFNARRGHFYYIEDDPEEE